MNNKIAVKILQKIHDAMNSLVDIIKLNIKSLEEQTIEQVSQFAEEKDFLVRILTQYSQEITFILKDHNKTKDEESDEYYTQIKRLAIIVVTLSEEYLRIVASKLYVSNSIVQSIQSVVQKNSCGVNLYNEGGRSLYRTKNFEVQSLIFNSDI